MEPQQTTPTDAATATAIASTTTLQPLDNRIAIITGASRGIGKQIAIHLSSLGANLVLNYTSPSSQPLAETLASQLNTTRAATTASRATATTPHATAVAFRADVSDADEVAALFNFAEQTFGHAPHIVVTSAGVLDAKYPTIANTVIADFDRILALNARGTFLCVREAAKRVTRGGGGRIVTVSSCLAADFRPGFGAYTASKAAVEAMTKILAKELKGTRITANCIAPGPVATEMFFEGLPEAVVKRAIDDCPLERLGKVEDIAPVVGFLVGDSGEWVNGQIIRVNGGFI
ncbi:NADPH-dependent aldehyde reductase-like protein, chloroplastic [Silene latifolia]|uniref:NADPH-dependent aldehyde reductase-like protein, chloroplastic n=1 Tax=Silene latifolia TaxID=37657 RepID=UPI003D77B7E2